MIPLLPIAGVMFAFQTSDLQGKAIVIALFAGSIFVWSVMLAKFREMRRARQMSETFLRAFRREVHPAGLYIKRQRYEGSPLYGTYEHVCRALGAAVEAEGGSGDDLFMGGMGATGKTLSEWQVNAVQTALDRSLTEQALRMESGMGFLATATTTAPFLGLLGTVWGVMDAFSGMAISGAAMLSSVAPGISGALLTTVVGLLVALPSSIGYNMLTDRIRRLTVELDNFAQELMSHIERHYSARR